VRVLQAGGELDLALEPVGADSGAHFGGKDLDHHLAAESALFRQEDTAHAPAAQLTLDAVCPPDSRLNLRFETDGMETGSG
jgi:hypothetical protein